MNEPNWTGHYAVVAAVDGKRPKLRKTETRIDHALRYARVAAKHEPGVEFYVQRVEYLWHVTADGELQVGVDKRTRSA